MVESVCAMFLFVLAVESGLAAAPAAVDVENVVEMAVLVRSKTLPFSRVELDTASDVDRDRTVVID